MPKLVTVVGARPQFVKAACVSRALARLATDGRRSPEIEHIVIHTGQHYDRSMSQVFFDELEISPPDYNLEVGSDSHGAQTGRMLAKIESILLDVRPDLLITYGDTNSTLAGALAASKIHILSAHVEAGLRSHNRRMPEEINRIIADQLSNLLFCPSPTAVANLCAEGIPRGEGSTCGRLDFGSQSVYEVGDVMHDSILFYRTLAEAKSQALTTLGIEPGKYCLATIHRAENTDTPSRLAGILEGIAAVAETGVPVVVPLHPRTKKLLQRLPRLPSTMSAAGSLVQFVDPVGYLDMIRLESNARLILTDSGGVQKEAFFLGVPCVTLRDETEWVETVAAGWNLLASASREKVAAALEALRRWDRTVPPFGGGEGPSVPQAVYGNGRASDKIVAVIAGQVGLVS